MDGITVYNTQNIVSRDSLSYDTLTRFISFLDAAESTHSTYIRELRQFFYYLREKNLTRPAREDILAFREHLQQKGLKPTTIQNYITAVKLFFKWTAQEGIYPDIAIHIKGAKVNKDHKKDALTSGQAKHLLRQIDQTSHTGLRDYAIITLMVTGALRTVEVSRADIGDLRTVGDAPALFVQGKGKEEKTDFILLPAETDRAIREYLKTRPDSSDPKAPLFTSTSNRALGCRMTTRSISQIAKDHLIDAGYNSSRLTAHSLRHTAVTISLMNGEKLEAAQQYARHANMQTTMIYAHHLERANNTCAATIAKAVF